MARFRLGRFRIMSASKTSAALAGQIQTLYRLGAAGSLSDRQLLARFLDRSDPDRSEAAFAELIERHGPMVLNVCERLLGDGQDAHDAFQATFLVLVRRGATIRKPESLASWLFGIATRVARQARREAFLRRQRLERLADRCTDKYQFASSPPDLVAEPAWPALYEEMDRLPEAFRAPLILHYFEGLSTEAIAVKLGCRRGTVLSRLARARRTLKDRLERRGVSSACSVRTGSRGDCGGPRLPVAGSAGAGHHSRGDEPAAGRSGTRKRGECLGRFAHTRSAAIARGFSGSQDCGHRAAPDRRLRLNLAIWIAPAELGGGRLPLPFRWFRTSRSKSRRQLRPARSSLPPRPSPARW